MQSVGFEYIGVGERRRTVAAIIILARRQGLVPLARLPVERNPRIRRLVFDKATDNVVDAIVKARADLGQELGLALLEHGQLLLAVGNLELKGAQRRRNGRRNRPAVDQWRQWRGRRRRAAWRRKQRLALEQVVPVQEGGFVVCNVAAHELQFGHLRLQRRVSQVIVVKHVAVIAVQRGQGDARIRIGGHRVRHVYSQVVAQDSARTHQLVKESPSRLGRNHDHEAPRLPRQLRQALASDDRRGAPLIRIVVLPRALGNRQGAILPRRVDAVRHLRARLVGHPPAQF